MRAELGDLHKQLKQLEERHLSEGSATSASNLEEEQRSLRNGYKTTLDDLRGAIIDLEREHEKLHVQYRRRLLDQANGLVSEGDNSAGLNAVTVSFYDLRWVTPAPASTLLVLCDFYMHPTQSGNVDASAWSKHGSAGLTPSLAKTFFDRTYKLRVDAELFAHLKTQRIAVEFCSIQDGGASVPLGKAHIALDALLLSHTGLCKEDAVSIVDDDGAVRAVFSCGVRFRTSIYSEARKFLRSDAAQSIRAAPQEPAAVKQRRISVSFLNISDLKTSASRVCVACFARLLPLNARSHVSSYVMCDIPGSKSPLSSQVVAVTAGAAPIDMRKVAPQRCALSRHCPRDDGAQCPAPPPPPRVAPASQPHSSSIPCSSIPSSPSPPGAADSVEQRHRDRLLAGARGRAVRRQRGGRRWQHRLRLLAHRGVGG